MRFDPLRARALLRVCASLVLCMVLPMGGRAAPAAPAVRHLRPVVVVDNIKSVYGLGVVNLPEPPSDVIKSPAPGSKARSPVDPCRRTWGYPRI